MITIYITGFIVCYMFDLTVMFSSPDTKILKELVNCFITALFFPLTLPWMFVVVIYLRSKKRYVFNRDKA